MAGRCQRGVDPLERGGPGKISGMAMKGFGNEGEAARRPTAGMLNHRYEMLSADEAVLDNSTGLQKNVAAALVTHNHCHRTR